MRILFLGLNYRPETIGIAVYSAGLCESLAARGHDVRAVSAQPYYPGWAVFRGFRGWWRRANEAGVDIWRCPLYVPANPTGLRRLVHHASFAVSALFPMLLEARRWRPDLVVTATPSMAAAPLAVMASRIAGATSWLHIQDFEVEAALGMGLIDRRSFLARAAIWIERKTIGAFDHVSTISGAMCRRLTDYGIAPACTHELRNWADIDRILPLVAPSPYRDRWDIEAPVVALYAGNIGNKQGIEIVVEAARRLRDRHDILFVICGEGPTRKRLEEEAAALPNVQIHDLQSVERLSELLGLASIHLLPQCAEAADLVLPSKLTNMLASGRPVVATAAVGTGLAVEVAECGICVAPGNVDDFARAIVALADDPAQRARLGIAARQRAEQRWHRDRILDDFEAQFMTAVANARSRVRSPDDPSGTPRRVRR